MSTTVKRVNPPALHIARVPGELGPVVRCSGDLTLATREALQRELQLLTSLRPVTLILNVAGCRTLDLDGLLLILEFYQRLRAAGGRLALVASTDGVGRIIWELGIDWYLPVFPTEGTALLVLRGGGPADAPPPPGHAAREETLAAWRGVLAVLDELPGAEVAARITASHGLCRRAEELAGTAGIDVSRRCYLCPLFQARGAHPVDMGCQSLTQPMLDALLTEDRGAARLQVARLISLMEAMPLPQE
ncbi:MAG: hypothetical protein K0Q72_3344 [Armatimonadetes bacterium]|nr:hypothetical protein [Armatimonadota bacterium]